MPETEAEARFSQKIRFINAYCMLMIVVIHAANLFLYPDLAVQRGGRAVHAAEYLLSYNIAEMGVPILMAVSAFLLYRTLTWRTMKDKLLRRVKSLLVPYVIWNAVYFLFFFAVTNVPALQKLVASERVAFSVKNALTGVFLHAYNPAGWFLLQLILYAALAPMLYPLVKRRAGAAVCVLAVLAANVLKLQVPYVRLNGLLYYLVGAAAGLHCPSLVVNRASRRTMLLSAAALLAFEIGLPAFVKYVGSPPTTGFFSVLTLGAFFLADALDFTRVKPPFSHSFYVYVLHMLVLGSIRTALYLLLPKSPFGALVCYALTAAGAVLLSVGAASLLSRLSPRLYSLLGGGRM